MRPLARIPLVATAALLLLTSTASAQTGSDISGPGVGGPTVIDSVTGPPSSVTVSASCVVAKRTGTTVWFGYSNASVDRRVALVGPGNVLAVNGVAVPNRGQITQFQPGVVERAFAVTVPVGSTASWTVTPASILGVSDASSSATSSGRRQRVPPVSVCARRRHKSLGASFRRSLRCRRLSSSATVSSYGRRSFSTNGVVSACSDGGVPLAPRVLWGYDVQPSRPSRRS